jgi:glycosyltransferase involved in cell wall biosynthesis
MMTSFTIIIATYNTGNLIVKTIDSIIAQSYKNFELIIIDGKSNDNTLDILNNYKDKITLLISENDNGIYDAWNKGLYNTKNEWILFLGAGDEIIPKCLENYTNFIVSNNKYDFISSKINLITNNGTIIRTIGKDWKWDDFSKYMSVSHVASLHNKNYFDQYGLFDIKYKIVGDYELLLRAKQSLKAGFLDIVQANMLIGGVSLSNAALLESYYAKVRTGNRNILLSIFEYIKAYFILFLRNLQIKFIISNT